MQFYWADIEAVNQTPVRFRVDSGAVRLWWESRRTHHRILRKYTRDFSMISKAKLLINPSADADICYLY